MKTITLILDEKEAEQFKLYQKHHDLFSRLEQKDCLSLVYGKVTLNFAFGELQNIVKEQMVYRKDSIKDR